MDTKYREEYRALLSLNVLGIGEIMGLYRSLPFVLASWFCANGGMKNNAAERAGVSAVVI